MRLRTGDLGIPEDPEDRSPSPPPVYNRYGKRVNTREQRARQKLHRERDALIQNLLNADPRYRPPPDWKGSATGEPRKVQEKVWIPQDKHRDINFIGLIIGPRGNTLKKLERESGAKIMIRGKGSVKEGRVRRHTLNDHEEESLHAVIQAEDAESLRKGAEAVQKIIQAAIETPEAQNELKRRQLRELASLNGTLRDDEAALGVAGDHDPQQQHTRSEATRESATSGNVKGTEGADAYRMQTELNTLLAELGEERPVPVTASSEGPQLEDRKGYHTDGPSKGDYPGRSSKYNAVLDSQPAPPWLIEHGVASEAMSLRESLALDLEQEVEKGNYIPMLPRRYLQ
eukprot:Clim_evm39s7 gene=Clim_evmTU39s7